MTTLRSRVSTPGVLLVTLISATIALTTLADVTTCVPAPPGLVGWWAGESNANDSAGTNNGALYGGMSFASGEAGQAFKFNGGSGYVEMPASAGLDVGAGTGLTFECWIKPAALADAQPLVEWNSGANPGLHLWISQPPPYGSGSGSIYVNLIDTAGASHTLCTAAGILNTNSFQHVALSYDKASGMTSLYYNGALVALAWLGSFSPQTSVPLYLGKRISDAPFVAFDGLLDEVSLYNRALAAAEIQAIYNAGSAGKCSAGSAPSITTQPASQTVTAGSSVTFTATATGTPSPSHQWRWNGTNIAGATGTALTLSNVQPAQAGNYTVLVTNAFGSITSSNALLTVCSLTNGLAVYYPFSGNANDASGNGKHGTVHGATLTADRFGIANSAYSFNGVSSEILVPETIFGATNAAWTMSVWLTTDSGPYAGDLQIYTKSCANGQAGIGILDGQIEVAIKTASQAFYIAAAPLLTNSTMHVVGVYRKGQSLALYVNGVMVTNTPVSNEDLFVSSFPLTSSLGSYHYNGGPYEWFRGTMDDFRVYTRALSATEVQQLYACESVPPPPSFLTNGLTAYYPFNRNANDASGNGNDGTVNGATLTADRFGSPDSAYRFNGTSWIQLPDTVEPPQPSGLTLSAWVLADSGPYDAGAWLIHLSSRTGEGGIALWNASSCGFWVKLQNSNPQGYYANEDTVITNVWIHLVAVYKQGQFVEFWVNGSLAESNAIPNYALYTDPAFPLNSSLGNYDYAPGPYNGFSGAMDDVRIYNRALSPVEVQALYQCEATPPDYPIITQQPQSRTVSAGSNVTFTLTASGRAPLGYQWRLNGTNITGATGTSLTLSNVQPALAGNYTLRVTNTYGSAVSSNAVLAVNQASGCATPPTGLVSWWRGEGAASDSAGTNTGVLEGGLAFSGGEVGQAFCFNGTNADVRLPASASLNVGLSAGFTIETWINPADITQQHPLVEWNDGSFGVHLWIAGDGPGALWFAVKDTGLNDHVLSSAAGLLVSNVWQHVAATYTKSNGNAVVYVNGVPRAQANLGVVTPRTIGDLYFGLRPYDGGAGMRFAGLMDEVSLYNRALSAAEIQAIYSADGAGKCPVGVAPSLTTQPASQTVLAGSNVTFTATAAGTTPLGYQWRWNGTNIAGATGTALTLSNVQPALAGNYTMRVTNIYGSAVSSNAVLAVNQASSCTTPPSGLVSWWRAEANGLDQVGANNGALLNGTGFEAGMVGQAFRFIGSSNSYVEVPDSPALRFTNALTIECWAKRLSTSEVHILVEKGGDYTGGHNDFELALNDTYSGGNHFGFSTGGGSRGCVVTPDTAWHHYAAVAVSGQSDPILYVDGMPRTITIRSGAPTMHLSASTRPLHIGAQIDPQTGWYYYSSTLIDEPAIYGRALSAAEIQSIYQAGSAGKCTTGVAPTIIVPPASQAVAAGSSATFTATAAGTSPLSYQWRFSGTNIAGATGTSLTLSNVQPAQAGSYAVLVTNAFGSITSSNALLTVNPLPSCVPPASGLVSWWRAEANGLDQVGGNNGVLLNGAGFDAGVVGQAFRFIGSSNSYVEVPDSPTLRFTNALTIECWSKRLSTSEVHNLVEKGGDWTGGQTDFEIGLNDTDSGGAHFGFSFAGGWRGCGVTPDTAWHHYAAVAVSGQSDPILYVDGVLRTVARRGGRATMNLTASTRPLHIGAQIDPQTGWYYYSSTMIDEPAIYSRALSAAEIQAIYQAGSAGKCTTGVAPSIIVPPASQTVLPGSNVTFTATAAGTSPLSYQWRFSGTNIAGATGTSLTLSNVQPAQAGNYAVLVTNAFGSISSSNALLTVNPFPSCVPPPSGLAGWWAGEGNALDSTGGNNGNLQGTMSFTSGVVGQAFNFTPASGTVVVPDSPSLRLSSQITVEAWINTRSTNTGQSIVSKVGGAGGNNGYQLALAGNKIQGLFNSPGQGWPSATLLSGPIITTGVWYHVAFTYDQSAMKLYCNGLPVATNVIGAKAIAVSSSNLRIGNDDSANSPADGLIDEPAVYSRALSAAEITAIYNAGSSGKCKTPPTLLNVNFAAYSKVKVGFAGTGQTATDFWNNYTAPFQSLASLSNLTMADGTPTTVGLTVQNGAGHWAFTHPDLMYNCYCYSQNHGDITVTVTNLPSGQYDFYLYGHAGDAIANTVFQVLVGGTNYGNRPTATSSDAASTNFVEGAQYVVYRNVAVTNGGAPVTIKAHPGSTGDALLNGMQISLATAGAQAQAQPAQVAVVAPSGSVGATMQLEVRGAPGRVYAIQASSNVTDWVTIGLCVTDTDGSVRFIDPDADKYPTRLYRVVGR
ncbi:MAG: LamG-like jellyroll fold domain-containing protein [Verrucomicrobiota bacterium]